jgi:ribonuclease P protein component
MLPTPNRLPHEAFRRVFQTGKRTLCDELQIIFLPNSLQVSRFGIQVGVNIDKRATHRNRMKRLIREAVRELLPDMKNGFDFIIIAQKNFSEKKEKEIEHSLKEILNHFQILNNVTI